MAVLWRRLNRVVDACICLTEEDAAQASQLGATRVEIIRNHRESKRFWPPPAEAAPPSRGHRFLFVGALDTNKQPEHFLEVARVWRARHPNDQFVIVGDGPLMSLIRASVGSELVQFRGQVTDVRPEYWGADALIVCSQSESGTGAAVEAGLAGLPVFAYPLHGLTEIAHHSGGAIAAKRSPEALISAIEGVAAALDRTPEERQRSARTFAAIFDSGLAFDRYRALFTEWADGE